MFDAVGKLDEGFGLGFFDDDDLCLRARKAGFRLVIALDCYVHHFGSRTFRALGIDTAKHLQSNLDRYRQKWGDEEASIAKAVRDLTEAHAAGVGTIVDVTAIGLGANRPQDAVYPTSQKDADGKDYNGADKYVMRFPKGQLPPVRGFWSLTRYDANYFFVDNPLNRYSISARQSLKSNPDGSTDLYVQNESPGKDKESNWLPAPKGKFILMLRLYWPNENNPSIINGSWKIPPVKKA